MLFNGWNTEADGSGTAYTDGQSITVSGNTILYAQWKSKAIDLSLIRRQYDEDYYNIAVWASDGDIITGWGADDVFVSIANGATVTLCNAHIATTGGVEGNPYGGIFCNGNATIILEGYNYVEGGSVRLGIQSVMTITIGGNGALDVVGDGEKAINGNVAFDGDFIDKNENNGEHCTILSRNPLLSDAADNGTMLGLYNGQSGINVTLSGRTLYKDGKWNTLCLPFNLSASK